LTSGPPGVDTDHLGLVVDEWSTRITRRNRRIGLDQPVECTTFGGDGSTDRRDDARGDTWTTIEVECVTDCNNRITQTHVLRVGEHRGGEAGHVDLDERKVVLWVGGKDRPLHRFGLVHETDLHGLGALDNVCVGQKLTVRIDDHPGADGLTLTHLTADCCGERDDTGCNRGGDLSDLRGRFAHRFTISGLDGHEGSRGDRLVLVACGNHTDRRANEC